MDLRNSWMTNTEFGVQAAHGMLGLSVVLFAALFFGLYASFVACGLFLAYATLKEWWYDATYEVPKQTWLDNLVDFGFLCAGASLGVALACLAHRVGRI